MRKSRYTEKQIIGFSDANFCKWRAKYGEMDVPDARRLRELEAENTPRTWSSVSATSSRCV
ncbi:putative transposase [Variovorax paradoxus B4]|uniref:Transposase n=2 Tax=Variovorax paradoxus TaxID=34073 RepID=A0A0H2M9C7_VARPD|nr:putative transposase [Variovorax paradoxus B4]KLN53635.1 hypothetical protein VPARA_53210 [Variovorax paradoxus]